MIARHHLATWALALLASACFGSTGTVSVSLVTAPGSTVLDSVQRIRLTLSDPRTQVEAVRSGGRFSLALEVPADGERGHITVEGFDSAERLVAYGQSPDFTVGPIDARVVVYVAAPLSVGVAPVKLATARFEVGSGPLRYGAVIAGGRGNDNSARGELEIYNAYDHTLTRGLDLPQPRAGVAVASTLDGAVYLVGGASTDGAAQGGVWRFDTNVAPAGSWGELPSTAAPRAGERALPMSVTEFLLTGPPAVLNVAQGLAAALTSPLSMPRAAATAVVGGKAIAVGVGARVVRYRDNAFDELTAPAALRTGHVVVSTADGQIAVLAGEQAGELSRDAVKIDPQSGAVTVVPEALAVARKNPAVARAGRYIVLAGGVSETGAILASAEVLDSQTLAHVALVPMSMPRAAAVAEPLPNEQVLILGGIDGRGRATDVLELFTPGPP